MAYKKIGTGWTPEMRENIDSMFKELYDKYTSSGSDASEAKTKALEAVSEALIAKGIAETTREEMLAIIDEQTNGGDIVPEVVQARGGETTLGERLNSVDSQLAETEAKKADKTEVQTELNTKRDKSVPIGLNDATPEMISAIEGGEGTSFNLLSVPRDASVTPKKATFLKESNSNLFDITETLTGKILDHTDGTLRDSANWVTSKLIPVTQGETYTASRVYYIAFYSDESETFVSGIGIPELHTFTVPGNTKFLRISVTKGFGDLTEYKLLKGDSLDYGIKIQDLTLNEGSVTEDSTSFFKKTGEVSPVNIYNEQGLIIGEFIDPNHGGVGTSSSFRRTDYIPVSPNVTLIRKYSMHYVYFDERKNFIGANVNPEPISLNGITGYGEKTPPNTAYVVMNINVNGLDEYLYVADGDPLYPIVTMNNLKIYSEQIVGEGEDTYQSPLSGLNGVAFGDSITHQGTYPSVISDETGANYVNVGFGGTRLCIHDRRDLPALRLSMVDISDAISSGDWTDIEQAALELDNSRPDSIFSEAINRLLAIDFNSIDFITIMYGTNDMGSDTLEVGADDSVDTKTIKGALNHIINNITSTYPHIKIYLMSPIFRQHSGVWDIIGDRGSDDSKITGGLYLYEIAKAIKEHSDYYHLPFNDNYYNSGINHLNADYYLADGVHPNTIGHQLLADKIMKFLIAS